LTEVAVSLPRYLDRGATYNSARPETAVARWI